MAKALSTKEWVDVIHNDYMAGLIADGGSAIKFVAPREGGLRQLAADMIERNAHGLGYFVARVDSATTRVHMPHEIFFAVAKQVDWGTFAKQAVLRLAQEAKMSTEGVKVANDVSMAQSLAEANRLEPGDIIMELRPRLSQAVLRNNHMLLYFRVAMFQLCLVALGGSGTSDRLVEWLTGVNRRVSAVRDYQIFSAINRTSAKRFLQSLLHWIRFVGYPGTVLLLDCARVPLPRNPHDGYQFYSRAAAMDHYELLRELIDASDRLEAMLMIALASDGFLDEQTGGKGIGAYQALMSRIVEEYESSQPNPLAALVRLSD